MNPLEVIIIGIGVVFATLGILTLSTYLLGWLIEKFHERSEDEKEKVAAIVGAIRSKGGS